jgi:hypothetical protein
VKVYIIHYGVHDLEAVVFAGALLTVSHQHVQSWTRDVAPADDFVELEFN